MGDASVGCSPYVKYGICLKYRPSITYALNFDFHVPWSSSIYLHTSDFLVKESSRERHPEDVLFPRDYRRLRFSSRSGTPLNLCNKHFHNIVYVRT